MLFIFELLVAVEEELIKRIAYHLSARVCFVSVNVLLLNMSNFKENISGLSRKPLGGRFILNGLSISINGLSMDIHAYL